MACLGVPQVEHVVLKDVIAGRFGLEGVEYLASFLIQALINHIGEEEWFSDVDGVLDQHLRVLLVQVRIQHPQVRHILLLGVLGVREACQALLKEVLGRQGRTGALGLGRVVDEDELDELIELTQDFLSEPMDHQVLICGLLGGDQTADLLVLLQQAVNKPLDILG